MANSADLDQLASSEANCSGYTLFAKAGHIRVQQVNSDAAHNYKYVFGPLRVLYFIGDT